jgi:hypothetical protein
VDFVLFFFGTRPVELDGKLQEGTGERKRRKMRERERNEQKRNGGSVRQDA